MTNWQFITLLICIIFMWAITISALYWKADNILDRVTDFSYKLIDYYFTSKEEHYKKCLQIGVNNRELN